MPSQPLRLVQLLTAGALLSGAALLYIVKTSRDSASEPALPPPIPAPSDAPASAAPARVGSLMDQLRAQELWRTDVQAYNRILDGIQAADMPEALQAAGRMDGAARQTVLFDLLERWARADPRSAAAWCQRALMGAEQHEALTLVASHLEETDPDAALRLGGPSPEVFHALAMRDPADATQQASQLPSGAARRKAMGAIAGTLFDRDPQIAVNWIGRLQTDNDKMAALAAVIPQMGDADPEIVGEYISELPATPGLTALGRDFAAQWARSDAIAAAEWAGRLPANSPFRTEAITAIAQTWLQTDRSAAAQWLAGTTLPEEQKQALLAETPP